MRNLAQYPVTPDEVELCCRDLAAALSAEGRIGDMRPLLLTTAAEVVKAAAGILKGIDRRMKEHDPPLRWVTPWKEATALINAFEHANPKPNE